MNALSDGLLRNNDVQGSALRHPSAEEVHLWLAFEQRITGSSLIQQYRHLLTDDERAQERRFHFQKDAHRYLVTRALVRTTLSRYCGVDPTHWRFEATKFGRPYVANPVFKGPPLLFNLSNTEGLVVCAIASGGSLGVDTEECERNRAPIEIADTYFAPAEVSALRSLPASAQQRRFFDYWTLKESYIKARSKGLSLPLDKFSFDLSVQDRVRLFVHDDLQDSADRWRFWLLNASGEHLVAVCHERQLSAPGSLTVRNVVPLLGDVTHDCRVLRRSDET
jgi:4'-phosphopantetheinyl transferase